MINLRFFLCILVIGLVACFIGLVIFFEKHPYLYYRLLDTIGGFLASALIIFCSAISGFCNWLVRKLNGDHKTQDPASKVEQKAPADQHHPKAEANGGTSPTSVVVNSEPTREEQVQNAVKFLSHPKVWVSPIMYRRSFLETKGLRKEEIDEAFRRVPDARFDWSDALSVIGIAAVSLFFKGVLEKEGESAKKTNSNPSLEKEIAAAEFAQSSQEILISKTEEKKCFEELVKEMKALSNAVQKLEGS